MGNLKGHESDHCICLLLTYQRNPVAETWSGWWKNLMLKLIGMIFVFVATFFLSWLLFSQLCARAHDDRSLFMLQQAMPSIWVLPPCAAGPLPHYNLIKEEDGRGGGVHEKITRNFGDDLALVHLRIASCPLFLWQPWKTLVLCNLSGSRLNQACWSLEDFVKVQPGKCGWADR